MQQTIEYIEEAKDETKKAVVFQGKARRVRMTLFCFSFDVFVFSLLKLQNHFKFLNYISV